VSTRYRVVPTTTFQGDIECLEADIVQREPARHTPYDTGLFRFRDAVERAMGILALAPHTCRRCEAHREFRELIPPFDMAAAWSCSQFAMSRSCCSPPETRTNTTPAERRDGAA